MVWICEECGPEQESFKREDTQEEDVRCTRVNEVTTYLDRDGEETDYDVSQYGDLDEYDSYGSETMEEGNVVCSDCESNAKWVEDDAPQPIKKGIEINGETYI